MDLETKDYRNILAMINRASVQGTEVEEIALLKQKIFQHVKHLEDLEKQTAKMDQPHKPKLAEVMDMERGPE